MKDETILQKVDPSGGLLSKVDGVDRLKPTEVVLQDFNACFGNCEVITLCNMNVTMPHLIAK